MARKVLVEHQTDDVALIAERAGIKIIIGRWPLVTVGEYDSRATINVNACGAFAVVIDTPLLAWIGW